VGTAPDKPAIGTAGGFSEFVMEFRRLDGRRCRLFLLCLSVLVLAFSGPLLALVRFALSDDLHSHILLIPLVSLYLAGLRMRRLGIGSTSGWRPGLVSLLLGLALLGIRHGVVFRGWQLTEVDSLALATGSFLAMTLAAAFISLGTSMVRSLTFPLAFLSFMIPFPTIVEHAIEVFFQRTSAEAAALLLGWSNVPVLRDGLIFRLPGIVIEVAEECSGIRSSFVLFITSLIAGSMLLRTPWTRAILTLAVIPLGIVRNGFRILTISLLCVHVSPEMIDSPIHHRGGPLFFALSLVPFFGLLILLRKWEKKRAVKQPADDVAAPAPERGLLP
jgi:exosortase C (VPDSG-CTERM-specific)